MILNPLTGHPCELPSTKVVDLLEPMCSCMLQDPTLVISKYSYVQSAVTNAPLLTEDIGQ